MVEAEEKVLGSRLGGNVGRVKAARDFILKLGIKSWVVPRAAPQLGAVF